MVGLGDIAARRVLPANQEDERSRLTGVVTREARKAASFEVPAFAGLDEALRNDGFDSVYVASPVFLHARQTTEALQHGVPMLCEQLMAMNWIEAQHMVDAAARSDQTLGVAYYRRTYPKVQRAMELIEQGVIGHPVMAFASCHTGLPADPKRAGVVVGANSGGRRPLYDIGSHSIDLLNYVFGPPVQAQACHSNAVHKTP